MLQSSWLLLGEGRTDRGVSIAGYSFHNQQIERLLAEVIRVVSFHLFAWLEDRNFSA